MQTRPQCCSLETGARSQGKHRRHGRRLLPPFSPSASTGRPQSKRHKCAGRFDARRHHIRHFPRPFVPSVRLAPRLRTSPSRSLMPQYTSSPRANMSARLGRKQISSSTIAKTTLSPTTKIRAIPEKNYQLSPSISPLEVCQKADGDAAIIRPDDRATPPHGNALFLLIGQLEFAQTALVVDERDESALALITNGGRKYLINK